jgi:hypothetical protein
MAQTYPIETHYQKNDFVIWVLLISQMGICFQSQKGNFSLLRTQTRTIPHLTARKRNFCEVVGGKWRKHEKKEMMLLL